MYVNHSLFAEESGNPAMESFIRFALSLMLSSIPDHPAPQQPTDNNPLGLMVPGLGGHCGGSNPANLMNLS
jgi:hypothetical protein